MAVLRFLALVLVVLAVMLLGADLVTSLELGGGFAVRSLGAILALFAADPRAWLQHAAAPDIAGPLTKAFDLPGWIVSGGLGFILALVSARRGGRIAKPQSVPPLGHSPLY